MCLNKSAFCGDTPWGFDIRFYLYFLRAFYYHPKRKKKKSVSNITKIIFKIINYSHQRTFEASSADLFTCNAFMIQEGIMKRTTASFWFFILEIFVLIFMK